MKFSKNISISKWLLISAFLLMAMACKDVKKSVPGENKSGSQVRANICELFPEHLIRTSFELSSEIALKKDESEIMCSYEWTANNIFHSITLNFARGGKRSDSSAQAVWESQNKGIYADKNMQKVAGVGDKATWSDLGGGQLRVLHDGYIFYVSHMDFPDDPEMTQEKMTEKLSEIAQGVVGKL